MEIFEILGSVNKISLIAFFIVLSFLIYEFILFNKDKKNKKILRVPNFNPSISVQNANASPIKITNPDNGKKESRFNQIITAVLFFMMIIFGGITLNSFFSSSSKKEQLKPKVIISEVSSKGIRIFDEKWKEIKDKNLIKQKNNIIIGIETIKEADIDRARIRINRNDWKIDDITLEFNKEFNVYYKNYQIASGESKLKIDAQLHSKQDGWLGD